MDQNFHFSMSSKLKLFTKPVRKVYHLKTKYLPSSPRDSNSSSKRAHEKELYNQLYFRTSLIPKLWLGTATSILCDSEEDLKLVWERGGFN